MSKIKIRGLFNDEDIEAVNTANPDFIGFVFAPFSKRYISVEKARGFKDKLDEKIKTVGVFVNEDIKTVKEIIKKGIIDIVQLHGEEDQKYIDEIKSTGVQIIKAYKIKDALPKTFLKTDYTMYDNSIAGSGESFDWDLIKAIDLKKVFLAGGINLDNVRQAIELNPFCIDVSSGAETNGRKDKEKIIRITEMVKNGK